MFFSRLKNLVNWPQWKIKSVFILFQILHRIQQFVKNIFQAGVGFEPVFFHIQDVTLTPNGVDFPQQTWNLNNEKFTQFLLSILNIVFCIFSKGPFEKMKIKTVWMSWNFERFHEILNQANPKILKFSSAYFMWNLKIYQDPHKHEQVTWLGDIIKGVEFFEK